MITLDPVFWYLRWTGRALCVAMTLGFVIAAGHYAYRWTLTDLNQTGGAEA